MRKGKWRDKKGETQRGKEAKRRGRIERIGRKAARKDGDARMG